MVILVCHNCGTEREVSTPPQEYVCTYCGAVNVVPLERLGTEALSCLAPTGFEWTLPAGVTTSAGGGTEYVTAQGTHMTRQEYLQAFYIDPEIAWNSMRKLGAEGREGFVNLSTLGKKKKQRKSIYEI